MHSSTRTLDATLFRRCILFGMRALERDRAFIDSLNVFPVPDGDTGTNMFLTMGACWREVDAERARASLRELVSAAARGALMGARGNSGVILSQFFRGFDRYVASLGERVELDPVRLAQGLRWAADTAYQAVIRPVEGTVLSVGRAAARSAERAAQRRDATVKTVLDAALSGARVALERTPRQLEVLAQAGVVDAGGQGLVTLFEAACFALTQEAQEEKAPAAPAGVTPVRSPGPPSGGESLAAASHAAGGIQETEVTFRYCTEFLVRGENVPQERVRSDLAELGDSLMVVGEPRLVKVHVHTNHPGRALELCQQWGELLSISINNMQEQNRKAAQLHSSTRREAYPLAATADPPEAGDDARRRVAVSVPAASGAPEPAEAPARSPVAARPSASNHRVATGPAGRSRGQRPAPAHATSVVAVVSGKGLADIFNSLGVEKVVDGGQTMNPSTEELVRAVNEVTGAGVVLLPNNKNVLMACEQVRQLVSRPIAIVPSRSIPEGLAAALACSVDLPLDKNASEMTQALSRVVSGGITYAVRNSHFGDHEIETGDVVGMTGDEVVAVGPDVGAVTTEVARRMLGTGKSLLTLYFGHTVERQEGDDLARKLRSEFPGVEVELYYGGQPLFYYLLSAE